MSLCNNAAAVVCHIGKNEFPRHSCKKFIADEYFFYLFLRQQILKLITKEMNSLADTDLQLCQANSFFVSYFFDFFIIFLYCLVWPFFNFVCSCPETECGFKAVAHFCYWPSYFVCEYYNFLCNTFSNSFLNKIYKDTVATIYILCVRKKCAKNENFTK